MGKKERVYVSLAKNNIRQNRNAFFPFLFSSAAMIALFYMISAVTVCVGKSDGFYGDGTLYMVLNFGVYICGIFAAGVIFYTDRFLMKQRAKELGLYSILGMEKRHIAKTLFWEMAMIGGTGILLGLFFGILFSRFLFLLLLKMMKLNAVIPFGIPLSVIGKTVLIFALVFLADMGQNIIWIRFLKPVDLLRSGRQGEQEPKAKWLQAILGIICLGIGYWIAVTTKNPIQAFAMFFMAVLLVMAGTYLLFQSGSVALLKLLKKNKKYYYHKTHFITVSGMMYRMKRNAAGLANICILSTAVLAVLSSTISLYAGIGDLLHSSYPRDVIAGCYYQPKAEMKNNKENGQQTDAAFDEKAMEDAIFAHASEYGVDIRDVFWSHSLFLMVREEEKHVFYKENKSLDNVIMVNVCSLEDFNQNTEEKEKIPSLQEGEVWAVDTENKLADEDEISLCEAEYLVRILPEKWIKQKNVELGLWQEFTVIEKDFRCIQLFVSSKEELEALADRLNEGKSAETGESMSDIHYQYMFNPKGEEGQIREFCNTLAASLSQAGLSHTVTVDDIYSDKAETDSMYAGVLFIGIFIGSIFLLAVVLIIYYKQISEGYEDRERFEILQKVGMDQKEVKKVITTQILQVFFLPLALASVHVAFAFPIVSRILSILELVNVNLFIGCTVGTILLFAFVYGLVYYLTARTYYRIVYGS